MVLLLISNMVKFWKIYAVSLWQVVVEVEAVVTVAVTVVAKRAGVITITHPAGHTAISFYTRSLHILCTLFAPSLHTLCTLYAWTLFWKFCSLFKNFHYNLWTFFPNPLQTTCTILPCKLFAHSFVTPHKLFARLLYTLWIKENVLTPAHFLQSLCTRFANSLVCPHLFLGAHTYQIFERSLHSLCIICEHCANTDSTCYNYKHNTY